MFPISVLRVVLAEFVIYVLTILGMHVSTDDKNVVFRDAMKKVGVARYRRQRCLFLH